MLTLTLCIDRLCPTLWTRSHAGFAFSSAFLAVLFSCQLLPTATHGQRVTLLRGHAYTEDAAAENMLRIRGLYNSSEAWADRATQLRQGLRTAMRLQRMPKPCPFNTIRHSVRQMDGYTVENVAFESLPGFWVTGNLYLPDKITGRVPAILNPHGHRENGRMVEQMQARCGAQARMGAVAFAYDMIGFGDSQQCEHRRLHVQRMQTYNSLRVVDFLLSLDQVDPKRIGVTGSSGGATQTFLLTALDDRIALTIPVAQVSAHFYGGCECESAMPIHVSTTYETNNVEIAALAAPRPQLIVSNGGDWTKNTPQIEFPHLQYVYGLLGAKARVKNVHIADEGHDYGPTKRAATYPFLAEHLGLDLTAIQDAEGGITETWLEVLPLESLRVFTPEFPRPAYAVEGGQAILRLLDRR